MGGGSKVSVETRTSSFVFGSIIKSADLENVGYAEVDGFYRFPSLSPVK